MTSFSDDIKKFNEKTEKKLNKVFRGTALSLFSKVILRTPVGNPSTWENPGLWRSLGFVGESYVGGRLRGNWSAQINTPSAGDSDRVDDKGGATVSAASDVVSKIKLGDSVFLTNNLPYAEVIEEGRSTQAPFGMVKITVAEFKYIAFQQARKHSK